MQQWIILYQQTDLKKVFFSFFVYFYYVFISFSSTVFNFFSVSKCHFFVTIYSFSFSSWVCFYLFDCNWTRTQNHLVLKQTLNHLAKLAQWLSVQATIECGFTLKRICDMTRTYSFIYLLALLFLHSLFVYTQVSL